MNERWLVNRINEMADDIKDLKELLKAAAKAPTTNKKK